MKELFPEYFINEDKVSDIWNDCLFVFDANFLCDFYRYSDVTRLEFINVMKEFNDRVWLPNRAVEEYLRNRRAVIKKQEALYVDVIKKLNTLEENLNHKKQHPFVNKKLHAKFSEVSKQLKEELEDSRVEYIKRINGEDEIKNKIVEIFDGKVGYGFTDEKLNEILEEGEGRYKDKVPPGYKDKDKEKDDYENQCLTEIDKKSRPYGDLIIWKQIIEKAEKDKVNVIFVTSDSKEDWWQLEGPNTLGPRGELVKEFERETEKFFYMYSPDRFLQFAQERLEVQVNEEALEEIKEIKKEDEKMSLAKMIKNKDLSVFELNKNSAYSDSYYDKENTILDKYKKHKRILLSNIEQARAENEKMQYIVNELYSMNGKNTSEVEDMVEAIKENKKYIANIELKLKQLDDIYNNASY